MHFLSYNCLLKDGGKTQIETVLTLKDVGELERILSAIPKVVRVVSFYGIRSSGAFQVCLIVSFE